MFEVFTKIKGENVFDKSSFPPNPSGFHANSSHIARFSCKGDIKPMSDDVLTPAYGFMLYQKLTRLLGSKSGLLRKKAVKELCNLYKQDQKKVVDSVRSGVLDGLLKLVNIDTDAEIREHSARALELLTRTKFGRDALLGLESGISQVSKSCKDEVAAVCVQSLLCLKNVGKEKRGQEVLCKTCIPHLISILKNNQYPSVKTAATKALCTSLHVEQSYSVCIENKVVEIFTEILTDKLPLKDSSTELRDELLANVSYCLAFLCFRPIGIDAGVQCKIISPLVSFLRSTTGEWSRESACAALMYLTLSKPGKVQFIKTSQAVSACVDLVCTREEVGVTRINALKILCNVVDNPMGRELLIGQVERLTKLRDERDKPFLKSLETTISKIVNIV